jgi:hypothetical protein
MEKSKKILVVASLCAAILGVSAAWGTNRESVQEMLERASASLNSVADASASQVAHETQTERAARLATTTMGSLQDGKVNPAPALWPKLKPLSAEERERFDTASVQIAKITKWGRLDKEELADFRQTLWELSDRGVAEYGRELSELSAETVRDEAGASKDVMNQVATLDYLSKAKRPAALEVVKDLATRPIAPSTSKGTPRVQRFVTLQVFDSFAAADAGAAREFIHALPESEKAPYVYHYYIGRQLAGVDQESRLADVTQSFGEEYVAKLDLAE